LSYSELAPLLAEKVRQIESDIRTGAFADHPLDDALILEIQSRITAELLPDWAGRWRHVDVTVGTHTPPPFYRVPALMRDYTLDLQARWQGATEEPTLLLEFLAFAEGRFLSIHPFPDFNGRVVRVFLSELMRRLDLPPISLLPETPEDTSAFFTALSAADLNDFAPLTVIWRERLHFYPKTARGANRGFGLPRRRRRSQC
jgi:CRISPR-associated endonuclease/helicase Cas3